MLKNEPQKKWKIGIIFYKQEKKTGGKVRMQDEGYLSRPFGRTGHKTSAAEMEIWKKSQNTKFLLEILVLHILK